MKYDFDGNIYKNHRTKVEEWFASKRKSKRIHWKLPMLRVYYVWIKDLMCLSEKFNSSCSCYFAVNSWSKPGRKRAKWWLRKENTVWFKLSMPKQRHIIVIANTRILFAFSMRIKNDRKGRIVVVFSHLLIWLELQAITSSEIHPGLWNQPNGNKWQKIEENGERLFAVDWYFIGMRAVYVICGTDGECVCIHQCL